MTKETHLCDYNDTDYKKDFWDSGERVYEDAVERLALKKLLPHHIKNMLEIGGGFGRLLEEYAGRADNITLLDYACNLLKQAEEKAKELKLKNFQTKQGDIYQAKFPKENFDSCLMVRVMHHIEDVPQLFQRVNGFLKLGGVFIFEYANKRNLLEIMRKLVGKATLDPFTKEPSRRGEGVYFNFHPSYIEHHLKKQGFFIEKTLMVSIFRHHFLKKTYGPQRSKKSKVKQTNRSQAVIGFTLTYLNLVFYG